MLKRQIRCERATKWEIHECLCCRRFFAVISPEQHRYYCRLNLDSKVRSNHFMDLFHAHKLRTLGIAPIRRDIETEYLGSGRSQCHETL